jgi:hypothetical protein
VPAVKLVILKSPEVDVLEVSPAPILSETVAGYFNTTNPEPAFWIDPVFWSPFDPEPVFAPIAGLPELAP